MWPPKEGLSTPTVAHEDAVLTLSASIAINAPASLVFAILRKPSHYSEWNTWCPKATIEAQPEDDKKDLDKLGKGTIFTIYVIMVASKPDNSTATRLIVTDISTPESPSKYVPASALKDGTTYTSDLSSVYRISWKGEGGFASKGLKSERFHEVIVTGDSACEVRTWEVMGGLLARTVKWLYKATLQEKFALWCEDLKKEGERAYRERGVMATVETEELTSAAPAAQ